jgi:spore coat polysaccharide biosynthesis protein SpsF
VRRVAIIQARMTSVRLPGKVLMDIAGRPMLEHVIARTRRCEELDEVVVATSVNVDDDPVVGLCRKLDVSYHRGSELDVLSRYIGAAESSNADLVVRITADCPLIDPAVADSVIRVASRSAGDCDYASNTVERTFPRGLDTEALFADVLKRTGRLATSEPAREHVTWFIYKERPDLFIRQDVLDAVDNSDLRWTVDTEEDLAMVRALYSAADTDMLAYGQLIEIVRRDPRLLTINSHIRQKDV